MNSTQQEAPVQLQTRLPHWAAGVLVGVMLAGLWQFASAIGQWSDMVIPQAASDFREGRTTGAIEKQIDQKMPARSSLIASANALRFSLLQGANEQVRVGRSDWLFLTEELQYDAQAQRNMAARLSLLGQTAHALQGKGVQLLLAVVPDKARIYEQYLPTGHYPEYNAMRYQAAIAGLQSHGVAVLDLLTVLQDAAKTQEVYYRTDTHWNQVGAKVAALALAKRLREMQVPLGDTAYRIVQATTASERAGDLIRLMGLEQVPNWLRPLPDQEAIQKIDAISSTSQNSLFGGSAVAVVLTGTSYSLRGNFHGHLQQALSSQVLNAAKDGGGFLQATGDYLKDEAFKTEPPQVIVWEVPERFMTLPLTQESTWLKTQQLAVH
jgi:alginate O-acetyltransferase complex protein AlgJ